MNVLLGHGFLGAVRFSLVNSHKNLCGTRLLDFLDSGKDEIFSEAGRFTTGIASDYVLTSGTTFGWNVQWRVK